MSDLTAVTAYGRSAGSARARVYDWLDHERLNVRTFDYLGTSDASPSTLLRRPFEVLRAERRLRTLTRSVDDSTVLVSRQASPLSGGHVEAALLERARRGVYDVDDALWLDRGRGVRRLRGKDAVWRRAVAAADVVIAGNEMIADEASRSAQEVRIIPTCVQPSEYEQKTGYAIDSAPRAVWLGSPSTERYLLAIADALLVAHASIGLRLTVISGRGGALGELESMIDRLVWSPAIQTTELARADFGIMPLTDSPWSRGKCAYKLLQYGAAALPLLGSPVGVNRRVLDLGGGLAVSTVDDWVGGIETLVGESADERRRRGRRARRHVEEHFSFAVWSERWREAVGLG